LRCRIEQRLSSCFGIVVNGWLNHTRGGQWTDPPIEEALKRVSDAGFRDVVYYPYGFLADNAESQLEGQLAAAGRPELKVRFVPCLNGSPELAQVIASQVLAAP
jgi:ferrochelatase